MKPFLTADTHFGHEAIIRLAERPFASVEEMDAQMVERWNEVIPEDGLVFHLGDFAFSGDPHEWKRLVKRLNGRIVLVKGNHDHSRTLRKLDGVFDEVADYLELNYEGREVVLFHYPMLSWRGMWRKSVHLHGHSHGKHWGDDVRRLNVGVECWDYRPIPLGAAVGEAMARADKQEE